MTFTTQIKGPDGSFGAHIVQPSKPNGAALVVIQEIFGVNDVMRALAQHYADLGYIAIVPDLFWRIEAGIELSDKTPSDMAKAFELFGKFNSKTGISDIQTTIDFARTLAPKVGAVGYCLGGMMAFLTACETNIDASVSYYGVAIDTQIDKADHIANPLLLHIASQDKFVSPEAQATILAAASANPQMTCELYQGQDHAFARPGGEHFDAAAAALANGRTQDFFAEHLL
jgi:carboxymethylenebutenolidase